jgi:LysM repeat protein
VEDAGQRRLGDGARETATPLDEAEVEARLEADIESRGAPAPLGWRRVPSNLPGRSPNPTTCPYFRSVGADARMGPPLEAPDPLNRCAALGDLKPQSYRQQELVCLTSGHVNCPRYLQAAAVRRSPMARPVAMRTIGRATGAATLVLAGALVVSVGFLVTRGGFRLPSVTPSPTSAALTTAEPSESPPPTPSATVSVEPSGSVAPTATTNPTPTPSPTPERTRKPERTPRPTQRSDRYDLLEPCPDRPRCWIYTVRSGDNLYSIANYFGVALESIYELNPWTRNQGLRAGQELILPPPTR